MSQNDEPIHEQRYGVSGARYSHILTYLGSSHYRPFATRTPVLLFLLLFTLGLISLIELACHSIPAHDGFGQFGIVVNNTFKPHRRALERRQTCELYCTVLRPLVFLNLRHCFSVSFPVQMLVSENVTTLLATTLSRRILSSN